MKTTTTWGTCLTLTAAAVLLSACGNMNIRPAPQGPQVYTAAHDTIEGDCSRERVAPTRHDGEFTVEDTLPQHRSVVKCVTETGGTGGTGTGMMTRNGYTRTSRY